LILYDYESIAFFEEIFTAVLKTAEQNHGLWISFRLFDKLELPCPFLIFLLFCLKIFKHDRLKSRKFKERVLCKTIYLNILNFVHIKDIYFIYLLSLNFYVYIELLLLWSITDRDPQWRSWFMGPFISILMRVKIGCNYYNLTITYNYFWWQLYIYNCFNHANYSFNTESQSS